MTASEVYFLDLLLTRDPVHAELALFSAVDCEGSLERPVVDSKLQAVVGRALRFVQHDLARSVRHMRDKKQMMPMTVPVIRGSALNSTDVTDASLQSALLKLDALSRCVVVLRLFPRYSAATLASLLQVSVGTVRRALAEGLAQLACLVADETSSLINRAESRSTSESSPQISEPALCGLAVSAQE